MLIKGDYLSGLETYRFMKEFQTKKSNRDGLSFFKVCKKHSDILINRNKELYEKLNNLLQSLDTDEKINEYLNKNPVSYVQFGDMFIYAMKTLKILSKEELLNIFIDFKNTDSACFMSILNKFLDTTYDEDFYKLYLSEILDVNYIALEKLSKEDLNFYKFLLLKDCLSVCDEGVSLVEDRLSVLNEMSDFINIETIDYNAIDIKSYVQSSKKYVFDISEEEEFITYIENRFNILFEEKIFYSLINNQKENVFVINKEDLILLSVKKECRQLIDVFEAYKLNNDALLNQLLLSDVVKELENIKEKYICDIVEDKKEIRLVVSDNLVNLFSQYFEMLWLHEDGEIDINKLIREVNLLSVVGNNGENKVKKKV